MADEKKFLDQAGLKQAFELIKANVRANYVAKVKGKGLSTNDFTDELKTKLENLDITGEENVLEVVKVNGAALEITDKAVDITSEAIVTEDAIAAALGFAPLDEETIDAKINKVAEEVAAINTLKYAVVDTLPEILVLGEDASDEDKAAAKEQRETIFLVPSDEAGVEGSSNIHVEYFIVDGKWEEIGDTQLKLDDYAKIADVEEAIGEVKEDIAGIQDEIAEVKDDVAELEQSVDEFKAEVEKEYVKEVEFVDKVIETVKTDEIITIIEENIGTITEAEIIAMFEQAPIRMHQDGTYDVVESGEAAIIDAVAGDTVVLIEDVEIPAGTVIADGVVLDLNGHTLTVKE